jgi:hypothetical protein
MKKNYFKLFVLLVFVLAFATTYAQVRYTATIDSATLSNIYNFNKSPVRYWKNNMSVAFVKQSSTTSVFCLIDHADFSNIVSLPVPVPNLIVKMAPVLLPISGIPINSDFTVNDIYIVDDYAFFCGYYFDGSDHKAFYGYFDINVLLGSAPFNINIHTLNNYSSTEIAPKTLTKLVAYEHGGRYKVVAIGNEELNFDQGCCKVVEINDAFTPSPCDVADLPIFLPFEYGCKIFVDDIILTSSYVIVLGHDIKTILLSSRYPWFAVGKRASVVADICSLTPNNNYYLPNWGEANDAVKGVTLHDDVFAMSYVYYENATYYTRLRVIDSNFLTNPYSQQFQKPEKENPTEMIYLKDLKKIELLQWITDSANFIQLDPFPTSSYYTDMLTPDGREYKSLSPIDGKRFISMCSGLVYLQDRTAALPHSMPNCPDDNKMYIKLIKKLSPINYSLSIDKINNNNVSLPPFSLTPIVCPIDNACYSYE